MSDISLLLLQYIYLVQHLKLVILGKGVQVSRDFQVDWVDCETPYLATEMSILVLLFFYNALS